jgi:hypothetical protein
LRCIFGDGALLRMRLAPWYGHGAISSLDDMELHSVLYVSPPFPVNGNAPAC